MLLIEIQLCNTDTDCIWNQLILAKEVPIKESFYDGVNIAESYRIIGEISDNIRKKKWSKFK